MLKTETEALIQHVRLGKLDQALAESLEGMSAKEFLHDLAAAYRLHFQERRLRNKWEVGLARSFALQPRFYLGKDAAFPVFFLVPVLRGCLLLSGEGDTVTAIAVLNRLAFRPISKPSRGVALTTGTGFQLDRLPDGWMIKPMVKRTTRLTTELLQKRGWRFDALSSFLSPGHRQPRAAEGEGTLFAGNE